MIKKITLLICLLCLTTIVAQSVEIRGKFIGYTGEMILIRTEKIDTLKVADDGSFTYQCKATEPYMKVGIFRFGKSRIVMLLNEGDKVEFTATKDTDGHITTVFKGDRKELNYYLTYYEYRNSFDQWPQAGIAAVSFKEHTVAVDKMEDEFNKLLDLAPEKEELIKSLRRRMHSAMLSLKLRYCWAIKKINKEPMDKDPDFVRFARSLDMNDEAWLEREKKENMTGYPNLLDGRIRWEQGISNDPRNYTDLNTVAYLETIPKWIKSENIINFLLYESLRNYLGMGGSARVKEIYDTFTRLNTDKEAGKEIASMYKTVTELAPGMPAPDFEMKDTNGKIYKLSDLRGKNLYIDVWATWCGPCVMEIPHFEKQYEKYRDNANLEFISISEDVDILAWKKKLEEDNPGWKQFVVDKGTKSDLAKKYGINGIPRFMLIDKEGKIITVSAPRPSDKKIDELLKKYSK